MSQSFFPTFFRHLGIIFENQKGGVLGGLFGYLAALAILGPSKSLETKLLHLSISLYSIIFVFMVYAAWRLLSAGRAFRERFETEDHYFRVAHRLGNYEKSGKHLARLEALVKDLTSGEYLRWK